MARKPKEAETVVQVVEPVATVDATVAPQDTPHSLADLFREAVVETGAEQGLDLMPTVAKKRGRPAREAPVTAEPTAPTWTPSGIGRVVSAAHDMAFRAFDVAELEDSEARELQNTSANFLNAVWPSGATYEPHAAYALTELSVIVPRVAAYQMRRREEAKRAQEKDLTDLRDKSVSPVVEE